MAASEEERRRSLVAAASATWLAGAAVGTFTRAARVLVEARLAGSRSFVIARFARLPRWWAFTTTQPLPASIGRDNEHD